MTSTATAASALAMAVWATAGGSPQGTWVAVVPASEAEARSLLLWSNKDEAVPGAVSAPARAVHGRIYCTATRICTTFRSLPRQHRAGGAAALRTELLEL